MKQQFYSAMPYEALAIGAMFIFFVLFIGVVLRVRRQSDQQLQSMAELPLSDGHSQGEVP